MLDPASKLFKVSWLVHKSLLCYNFLFRNLSAFLPFYFFLANLADLGKCLEWAAVIQNHIQNSTTFFAHFRPLNFFSRKCRIISFLKLIRKTPASPRFTKTIILLFRYLADRKWPQSIKNSDNNFLDDCK